MHAIGAPARSTSVAAALRYRPPLDGLRAVAVGGVLATHTDLPIVGTGGAFGVDVFLVLSGFLITTLLLEELAATGGVAFPRFYARRALRLFPALLTVLAVVAAYAQFFAPRELRAELLREIPYAATYTSNFSWLRGFEADWLAHTWSLALEEQFYLVWPPLLFVIHRLFGVAWVKRLLVAVIAMAIAARPLGHFGPGAVLTQRPDALLIGAVIAIFRRESAALARVSTRLWSLLGLSSAGALGAVTVVAAERFSARDGLGFTVVAVSTGALVLSVVFDPQWWVARALAARPLVEIGKRSYGIYLWHLPIYRWVGRLELSSGVAVVALRFSLTLGAAWLCYAVVERPALRLKRHFKAPVAIATDRGQQAEDPDAKAGAERLAGLALASR